MKDNYLKFVLFALIAVVAIQGYYLYDLKRDTDVKQVSAQGSELLSVPLVQPFNDFFKEDKDPVAEMERLRREMENSFMDFDNFFQTTPYFSKFTSKVYRTPRFDMKEKGGRYIITMEVPGIDKSKIDVKSENGQLIVSAKLSEEKDDNTTRYYRHERRTSSFKRVIALPTDTNEKSLHTEYENGLLIITFEKNTP